MRHSWTARSARLAMQAGARFGWEIDVGTQLVTYSDDQRAVLDLELPESLEDRWAIVHPEDREPSQEHYRRAMETGVPFIVEQRLFVPGAEDRVIIWVSIAGRFIGAPPRFVGTTGKTPTNSTSCCVCSGPVAR